MEGLIRRILCMLVKIKRRRSTAKVIGITGSMGKTSTKNAIVHVLETKYQVKSSRSGYNTAIGIPLMLFDLESPGRSPLGWLRVLMLAGIRAFRKDDWDYIVVEMGVDKPGDMDELLEVIRPDIAVITAIARVHTAVGQFKTEEEIAAEKLKITKYLGTQGTCIYNIDNDWLRGLVPALDLEGNICTYGTREEADMQASDIHASRTGIRCQISYGHDLKELTAPVLGRVNMYTMLAAVTVAVQAGMKLDDALEACKTYQLPRGRMNLIEGINGSMLIDSSYNASTKAVEEALNTLKELEADRRIAVLGQMNEMGDYSEEAHQHIGRHAAHCCDMLLCVYGDARLTREAAIQAGMNPRHVLYFADSEDAGTYLKEILQSGDMVLFKGSQNNVRLEKAIKLVMAEPQRAAELLVRQTGIWSKK